MGERERVVPEIGHGTSVAPVQPPAPPALALVHQAHALVEQARVLADQAQVPFDQAQAFADQAHVLANQAQALGAHKKDVDESEKGAFAYQEIANLHDIITHYPIYKLALEEWERRGEYLRNSVSRREGQSVELTNQISNIFSVFVVFLGLVLIAVSHLTTVSHLTQSANTELGGAPVCGKVWFPIAVTSLGTLVTLVGISNKFRSLHSLELVIHKEKQTQNELSRRAFSLRRIGPEKFSFIIHTESRSATNPKLRKKSFQLVNVAVLLFTFIFIVSYFVILCDTWVVRS